MNKTYRIISLFGLLLGALLIGVLVSSGLKTYAQTEDDVEHIEKDDLYVSDGYFKKASSTYNPHLATLSMVFANATMPAGDPDSENDTDWFEDQPRRLNEFFTAIHFTDFEVNNYYKESSSTKSIGVGAAKKEIDDFTVIAVGIRSGGYYREWANNVWLGDGSKSDYMHEGWYNAAHNVLNFLDGYITKNVTTSKIKIWIAGFSRGGATANITAGLLDNKIDKGENIFKSNVTLNHDDLYAYTFEAPQGANINSKTVKAPNDAIYNNIWNIINPNDVVPKVAMSQWGFTRFGTDKYVKTNFYDPENEYENHRSYLYLLSKILKTDNFDSEDIQMKKLPGYALFLGIGSKLVDGDFTILVDDDWKVNYDSNILTTLFIEEMTSHIGSRDNYVKNFQTALSDLLERIMANNYEFHDDHIYDTLIEGGIAAILVGGVAYGATGNYQIFEYAVTTLMAGAPEPTIRDIIKLGIPMLPVIYNTFDNRPTEVISIIKNVKTIGLFHNTERLLAHLQAQDSYYVEAYNATKPADYIDINQVDLMDNADFGRVRFNGMNELSLYKDNVKKVFVDGKAFGTSDVKLCKPGYAVGYYSYFTTEKMELFFPVNAKYKLTSKSHSKLGYHSFDYKIYRQYNTLGANNNSLRKQIDSFEDWAILNSKLYSKTFSI